MMEPYAFTDKAVTQFAFVFVLSYSKMFSGA